MIFTIAWAYVASGPIGSVVKRFRKPPDHAKTPPAAD